MLRVGLTGGIGSGKSAAAALFAEHGVSVIDADLVARELVRPGQSALVAIVNRFGPSLIDATGELKRSTLRERVFSDPAQRRWLENLLHPLIRARMLEHARRQTAGYAVLVIPLLFEQGWQDMVDTVVSMDVTKATQRQRAMRRDDCDGAHIDAIMATQLTRSERNAGADYLLHNDGDPASLRRQVEELHQRFTAMAQDAGDSASIR